MSEQINIMATYSEEKRLAPKELEDLNRTANEVVDGEVARELSEKESKEHKNLKFEEDVEDKEFTSTNEDKGLNSTKKNQERLNNETGLEDSFVGLSLEKTKTDEKTKEKDILVITVEKITTSDNKDQKYNEKVILELATLQNCKHGKVDILSRLVGLSDTEKDLRKIANMTIVASPVKSKHSSIKSPKITDDNWKSAQAVKKVRINSIAKNWQNTCDCKTHFNEVPLLFKNGEGFVYCAFDVERKCFGKPEKFENHPFYYLSTQSKIFPRIKDRLSSNDDCSIQNSIYAALIWCVVPKELEESIRRQTRPTIELGGTLFVEFVYIGQTWNALHRWFLPNTNREDAAKRCHFVMADRFLQSATTRKDYMYCDMCIALSMGLMMLAIIEADSDDLDSAELEHTKMLEGCDLLYGLNLQLGNK